MTQPPQDGFNGPQYPGRQPPPPPQQPPQQPPHGYGYPGGQPPPPPQQAPQHAPQQPQSGQPYGYPGPGTGPYGQPPVPPPPPGYGYPPRPPGGPAGSKRNLAILIGVSVVALLLVVGGVWLMVGNDDDGGGGDAKEPAAPSASPSPSSSPTDPSTGLPTDEPTGAPTDFGRDTPAPHSKEDGFKGQWQDDENKTLTIGEELKSGKAAGKNSVSYIDPGGDGFCMGLGQEQSAGSVFRVALKCGSGDDEKYISGNSRQDGDSLTITWDKGGSDTLDWIGGD